MADDRPRPTETDQDADDETPRAEESDSEVRQAADAEEFGSGGDPTDAENAATADADETGVIPESDETGPSQDAEEAGGGSDAGERSNAEEGGERPTEDAPTAAEVDPDSTEDEPAAAEDDPVPADVRKYERFKKMDGAQYDRVNEFLRDRTYITAREWAIARLCADFRTETGVEMTKIGDNLPELVPFMTDTYTPQAVNQARSSFEDKVRQAGATFLYGAMSGFFTAEELDDMMYEVTEVAKFLLEVEGVDLSVEEELAAEDRISGVMRDVRAASEELRHDELECPNCGHEMEAADDASTADD